MIRQVHQEKAAMLPMCAGCASPCGRNNDYDLSQVWAAGEPVGGLKALLLLAARELGAFAHRSPQGEPFYRTLNTALFAVGEDWDGESLLPVLEKVGQALGDTRLTSHPLL